MAEPKGAAAAVTVSFLSNGIAIVHMQRGENRINAQFISEFTNCLDKIESTPTCKGVILTGDGKFFSNGLDLKWLESVSADGAGNEIIMQFSKGLEALIHRLLLFPLPTIAAINGHCYAGGGLLAFACDMRVMNNHRGWFCFNEVFIERRFPPFHIQYLKLKITSPGVLHKVLAMGQRFTGPEAAAAGLIDKAVAPPLVLQESQRMLLQWIGKDGFPRESLHNMKADLYANALEELKSRL